MGNEAYHQMKTGVKGSSISSYLPLLVLILIAVLASVAITYGIQGGSLLWMHYFMGLFLCQFAMLKLFDLEGFAEGFQMYDLIAKRFRPYALLYPFIELGLGLSYLAMTSPFLTYLLTLLVMAVSIIGVVKALAKGMNIYCSCMGTILRVPLSTVTLSEDIGMGIMAILMLLMRA